MRKAALEIGIDGQIDRGAQRGEMLADLVERDAIVGLSDRPGKAGAGGGQRLEAQCCNARALPTSKGLGSAKQPVSCIFRNVARLSAVVTGMISPFFICYRDDIDARRRNAQCAACTARLSFGASARSFMP